MLADTGCSFFNLWRSNAGKDIETMENECGNTCTI